MVEVGPGPGGITRSLLARGAKEVHVIEKDARFLPSLRLLQAASRGALKINVGDVLNYNISSEWGSCVHIMVGYHIGTWWKAYITKYRVLVLP